MTERTVTIPVSEILDIVAAAEDYEFAHPILLAALRDWAGDVTPEEVVAYAKTYAEPDAVKAGYTDEDVEIVRERLMEWLVATDEDEEKA